MKADVDAHLFWLLNSAGASLLAGKILLLEINYLLVPLHSFGWYHMCLEKMAHLKLHRSCSTIFTVVKAGCN